MKFLFLCALSATLANAFVVPGPKTHIGTTSLASSLAMDNRMMRNRDFRNDGYYGGGQDLRGGGYNGGFYGGAPLERYERPRPNKNFDERRFEFANNNGGPRRDFYIDDRDMLQGPYQPRQRMDRSPIVESADGRNMLERYDPNRHRNNGESRFEPSQLNQDYERLRDGPMGFGVADNFAFDQPYDRPGNLIVNRGANRDRSFSSENSGRLITPDNGRLSNRDSEWWNGNPSGTPGERAAMRRDRQEMRATADLLKSGGSGMFQGERRRNERRPQNPSMGMGRGLQNPNMMGMDRGMQNPNMGMASSMARRPQYPGMDSGMERRAPYPGMERGMERGMDRGMERGMERGMDRGMGRGMDRGMDRGPQYPGMERSMERRPVNPNMDSRFAADRYERASPNYGREERLGRRWEEPYRVGDRTSLATDTLQGPQRLDGGTRRQWTFEANVGSVQLEMWTEGLPLMATVEIFEKGGQKKNSFDVYVEDGYNRPYSTVLDLPRQSGGTILIRNDGPIEYPIVANVQPFARAGDGMRNDFPDDRRTQGW